MILPPRKRGETLRCDACQCTWEGDPNCWLCGQEGETLNALARLKMHRSLYPVEEQVVPV